MRLILGIPGFRHLVCTQQQAFRLQLTSRASAHTSSGTGSSGPYVAEELTSRLQDKELVQPLAFIGNEWTPATDGSTYTVVDPSTDQEIARIANLKGRETHAAIAAAHAAFPAWSKRTAKERGAILRKWYDLVVAAKDDICTIMTFESGKPLKESQAEFVGGYGRLGLQSQ